MWPGSPPEVTQQGAPGGALLARVTDCDSMLPTGSEEINRFETEIRNPLWRERVVGEGGRGASLRPQRIPQHREARNKEQNEPEDAAAGRVVADATDVAVYVTDVPRCSP